MPPPVTWYSLHAYKSTSLTMQYLIINFAGTFRFTYHNVYDEENIDSYDYNGNGPYNDSPHSA